MPLSDALSVSSAGQISYRTCPDHTVLKETALARVSHEIIRKLMKYPGKTKN